MRRAQGTMESKYLSENRGSFGCGFWSRSIRWLPVRVPSSSLESIAGFNCFESQNAAAGIGLRLYCGAARILPTRRRWPSPAIASRALRLACASSHEGCCSLRHRATSARVTNDRTGGSSPARSRTRRNEQEQHWFRDRQTVAIRRRLARTTPSLVGSRFASSERATHAAA